MKIIKNIIIIFSTIVFFGIPIFYSLVFFYNREKINYLDHEVQDFEVVVARYNEDLSWIETELPNEKVIIYNKGKDDLNLPSNCKIIKLPNIGREAHTYLYHIINNYNNLAERTLFLQGSQEAEKYRVFFPLKRYKIIASTNCDNIIAAHCFLMNENLSKFGLIDLKDTKWSNTIMRDYDFVEFKHKFIETEREHNNPFYGNYGAIFAVDKHAILRNDVNYYQNIFNTLDNIAPIEGHYLEKLWDRVFSLRTSSSS